MAPCTCLGRLRPRRRTLCPPSTAACRRDRSEGCERATATSRIYYCLRRAFCGVLAFDGVVMRPRRLDAVDAAARESMHLARWRSRQNAVDATARRWLDASERSIASAVEMRIPPEGAREAELKAAKDDQLPGEHRLSDEQRTIVALAAKQPLSILAGGPGTGKTFAAKFVVRSRRPVV